MKKCKQEHNYPDTENLPDIVFYDKTVKIIELQHACKFLENIVISLLEKEIIQVLDSPDNKKSGAKKEKIVKRTLGKTVYKLRKRLQTINKIVTIPDLPKEDLLEINIDGVSSSKQATAINIANEDSQFYHPKTLFAHSIEQHSEPGNSTTTNQYSHSDPIRSLFWNFIGSYKFFKDCEFILGPGIESFLSQPQLIKCLNSLGSYTQQFSKGTSIYNGNDLFSQGNQLLQSLSAPSTESDFENSSSCYTPIGSKFANSNSQENFGMVNESTPQNPDAPAYAEGNNRHAYTTQENKNTHDLYLADSSNPNSQSITQDETSDSGNVNQDVSLLQQSLISLSPNLNNYFSMQVSILFCYSAFIIQFFHYYKFIIFFSFYIRIHQPLNL